MATYSSPAQGRITQSYKPGVNVGTDIAPPTPGQTGQPVAAWTVGTVEKTGVAILPGRSGNGVLIGHPDGTKTYYGHLASIGVSVGQQVATGQTIGIMGSTGNSTGIHVHFEIHVGGKTVNPEPYASARGIKLGSPIQQPPSPAPTPTPAPPVSGGLGSRTIQLGSNGPDVAQWQLFLNRYYNLDFTGDGDFGPLTDKWTRTFQERSGLFVDGQVGPKTLAKAGY